PEEYALIELCVSEKLPTFYNEVAGLFGRMLSPAASVVMLRDALTLNQALIKLPFQALDRTLDLDSNVWEVYRGTVLGQAVQPTLGACRHHIARTSERWSTWDEWCEPMVWYGNRRGAYLYGRTRSGSEIAGHH